MLSRLLREPPQHVQRVETVADDVPPPALPLDAIAVCERERRGDQSQRYRDHPWQREPEARMCLAAGDDDHRGDGSSRREDRVLERAEAEDADARDARVDSRRLEGEAVDDEAAADDEDAEARSDDRARPPETHRGPPFHSDDLAVRHDVPDVRSDLEPECDRKPEPVEARTEIEDPLESGCPRNTDERTERQRAADAHEQRVLHRVPLEVRQRTKEGLQSHLALRVGVAVTPYTKHGVARARNHPNEGKRVVARKALPEVGADSRDDHERGAVEDDAFP